MTKQIFSPYRICPIGAHIDHQGGAVLGRTISIGTTLEYEPLDTNEIYLTSAQFGETRFRFGDLDKTHWARYAQAAVCTMPNLKRGMKAYVNGTLIGTGLSSSASVGLAYIQALADVNDIDLNDDQFVQLEFQLEHDILNLQIGLLDPLTIIHGRRNALLFMDTITGSVAPIFDSAPRDFAWIVAYSGISRELTRSGFNVRVDECRQAASMLRAGAQKLSDVPKELFEEKQMSLPENLRKRAGHFFSEVDRVQHGAEAWKNSNFAHFGELMNQSCRSSISSYESGSNILIELHKLVSSTNGIYGSRFSGGGYGGCVIALASPKFAQAACQEIERTFRELHPELPSRVFIVEVGDGLKRP